MGQRTVFVIGLCFGQQHVQGMLAVADHFCQGNLPGIEVRHIVVDNALAAGPASESVGFTVVPGLNTYHEFSGWQQGLDYIDRMFEPSASDIVLLINDTVHRRRYSVGGDRYFENYRLGRDVESLPPTWAAGYLDDFPRPASILGIEFTSWIRSNFLVFTHDCVQYIRPLVVPLDERRVFGDATHFWADDAPISRNWRAYISSWLFGEADPCFPEYRLNWIKAEPLSQANMEFFRKKAMCILSEHYLTARLQRAGVPIIDFNDYPKLEDRHVAPYYG